MVTTKFVINTLRRCGSATLLALVGMTIGQAANMNIDDKPLFLNASQPPLNMLVMSRDHRMYYEAYNDASDLDGDGKLDVNYLPAKIDYYGYFDSHVCYDYNTGNGRFEPAAATTDKTCSKKWSGDWLNYMTTSRIDALRKVLYGGSRAMDSATETVLQRAWLPQDAHSWGKEYYSPTVDGYDISQYTPLSQPAAGNRHLFANTTPSGGAAASGLTNPWLNGIAAPKFRVLEDRHNNRIWEWVSKEQPVAGTTIDNSKYGSGCGTNDSITGTKFSSPTGCSGTGTGAGIFTDYNVRVRVCVDGIDTGTKANNCHKYPSGDFKPVGLLQEYGENDSMYFGLISGSYGKPHDGGVLRKALGSVKGELDLSTGQFVYNQDPPGIISTIDRMRITSFNGSSYACGWIANSADAGGACSMWGNPTAEMMYEAVRYFAGKSGPNPDFVQSNTSEETTLGLKVAPWNGFTDPYGFKDNSKTARNFPVCSKPFETVISDASPSYDSDKVPGSYFGGYSGDIDDMNAAQLGQSIWNTEITTKGGRYFIGQSAGDYDGVPTDKPVSSFGEIRGLSPEAPAKEGSYNAASVAYYGISKLQPSVGTQKLQTFAVALASPLPQVKLEVGGNKVTLVPFAKSVGGGYSIDAKKGAYQPTNQIVDFYVESLGATSGTFRVNYEDVEQGADHDMDAIATYHYEVTGSQLTVTVTSNYAAGGIVQHMGYVISGTTEDGTYLVVRDNDTSNGGDTQYFLDKPLLSNGTPAGSGYLGLSSTHTFTASGSPTATFLKDPLWYAAKWGGFKDSNEDGKPGPVGEWDEDGNGDPDNYFLVTNAAKLKEQLSEAFNEILNRSGSASSASVSSGSISDDTRIYQATFDASNWSGHLTAYRVGTGQSGTTEGALGTKVWDAAEVIPAPGSREILTVLPALNGSSKTLRSGVPFSWANIAVTQKENLNGLEIAPGTGQPGDGHGEARLDFLRGDRTNEGGIFRKRTEVLGDIVNSAPVFVGAPPWRYPDSYGAGQPETPYSTFVANKKNRRQMVYTGANDGMLHAFAADTGGELFAYVPQGLFRNLYRLSDPAYTHRFYVDGSPAVVDAFFNTKWHSVLVGGLNKGGQSIYALDVTDPAAITEDSASDAVLWEFTDASDADLGYTYSRPAVVKLQNGSWAAIFGNGYNNTVADGAASVSGNAVLYVVDIATGGLLAKLDTMFGLSDPASGSRPNGLSTPVVIDQNGDGRSDTVYAGDLMGNLWKFDLSGATSGDWKVAYGSAGSPLPLFVARDGNGHRQPITERPQVGRGPYGQGWMVLFGTGKFLEPNDRNVVMTPLTDRRPQTFYGVIDKATGIAATDIVPRSQLLQQTVVMDTTYSWKDKDEKTHTSPVRVTSDNKRANERGWYLDLVSPVSPNGQGFQGEMQVTNPVLRNGRVIFTTLIPDSDPCAYGGRSWLMDVDAISGSRLAYTPFDLNTDLAYTSKDFIDIGGGVMVPVSGRGSDSILTSPAFLSGAQSDYAVTTSSGSADNSNTIGVDRSNAGPSGRGRQSWRQLR